MLDYEVVKRKRREHLALTGLTIKEFKKLLAAFEQAERTDDPAERASLLTFVVVGGGPTGVEMAGSICELAHQSMKNDFRSIDPASARIILIENSKLILDKYHVSLSETATRDLKALGAEIWNETRLLEIYTDHVIVSQGRNAICTRRHFTSLNTGESSSPSTFPLSAWIPHCCNRRRRRAREMFRILAAEVLFCGNRSNARRIMVFSTSSRIESRSTERVASSMPIFSWATRH